MSKSSNFKTIPRRITPKTGDSADRNQEDLADLVRFLARQAARDLFAEQTFLQPVANNEEDTHASR